jgi:hypothetical protein
VRPDGSKSSFIDRSPLLKGKRAKRKKMEMPVGKRKVKISHREIGLEVHQGSRTLQMPLTILQEQMSR